MPSVLRYSAVAAMVASTVSAGKLRGEMLAAMASQTVHVGGSGLPIFEAMPTEPPSLELVKRKLELRAETNTCTEWTILGDNGFPVCSNSQTCLFSTVGDLKYEGCGMPDVGYDWVTECWDYPKAGTPGPSQVYCNSALPTCGVFEFIFDDGITFSNFGCGSSEYKYIATLTDKSRTIDLTLESGSTIGATGTGTVFVTATPTDKTEGSNNPNQGGGSPTQVPSSNKAPIGAIVGGVIGGVAVIALLGFIAWYCLRQRKKDKEAAAATQQQEADAATAAAFHNSAQTAQMNEMEGSSMKPGVGAFAPPLPGNHFAPAPEKIGDRPGLQPNQYSSGYSTGGSPPPVYPQPGQLSSPSSQYTELDTTRQSTVPSLPPGSNLSELGGGDNRMSYQGSPPPPLPEMGDSTGGINRPAVGRQRQPGVDMSGAPMSSDYRPHELP